MKKKILTITKYAITVFIVLFVIIAIYTKIFPDSNGILGMKVFVVASESMKKEYKVGDIIFVYKSKMENIKIGDNITYKGLTGDIQNKIITHKVENIVTEGSRHIFYTKGTENDTMDRAVYEEQVYGKVIFKPFIISLISRAIRTWWGFILLVIFPLTLLFLWEFMDVKKIIKKIKPQKKVEKIEENKEDEK